jgi:tRNA (guanine37-N1)-methyltransferase
MAMLDAIARLQPGVLGDEQSHAQDSFNPAMGGLLDHPHYTRPEVWRGKSVPPVLLSGNHAEIERWRLAQRQSTTQSNRPDLQSANDAHP